MIEKLEFKIENNGDRSQLTYVDSNVLDLIEKLN